MSFLNTLSDHYQLRSNNTSEESDSLKESIKEYMTTIISTPQISSQIMSLAVCKIVYEFFFCCMKYSENELHDFNQLIDEVNKESIVITYVII